MMGELREKLGEGAAEWLFDWLVSSGVMMFLDGESVVDLDKWTAAVAALRKRELEPTFPGLDTD